MIVNVCDVTGLPIECTKSSENIKYTIEERHPTMTSGHKIYLKKKSDNQYVSPLHDIPLNTEEQDVFRVVIVMPNRTSQEKRIDMKRDMNPIVNVPPQETGPDSPVLQWAYGALPQTFEDASKIDPRTFQKGDNGQLDVIVLGKSSNTSGAVVRVKIVAAYPMIISESMTDWKMIAIDVNDKRAAKVNSIQNFNGEFPNFLDKIKTWLIKYRVKPGQHDNQVFQVVDAQTAVQVVKEKHNFWKILQEAPESSESEVKRFNTTLNNHWWMEKVIIQ